MLVERYVLYSAVFTFLVEWHHRYHESLNRLLKVRYLPTTSVVLISLNKPSFLLFFAAAINSTNEANKVASMRC
jgi:hypothetical protein